MIILASASPRRKQLLSTIISDFDIVTSNVDEAQSLTIKPKDFAEHLAVKKALNVFHTHQNDIVIGSDTVIIFNEKIYGKPTDKDDAKTMLQEFSGKTHFVITGVCIASADKTISFSSVNEVEFYPLSDKEIDSYLESDEYKDKAGSYAIQGKGALFIKKIKGDYNSIVGLPVSQLYRILKEYFNI